MTHFLASRADFSVDLFDFQPGQSRVLCFLQMLFKNEVING